MKSLFAGIVLLLVLGLGGFLYRNIQEHTGGPTPVACTMEAKICPDGSAVGRSGPDCAFAACAFPNVEFSNYHIAFALPAGYSEVNFMDSASFLGVYDKPTNGEETHSIAVHIYPIPEGKTGSDVIIAHTVFEPSDMPATDLNKFKSVLINGRTFQSVVIERFEGVVHSAYYLVRTNDVLRFEIVEQDVDWTNPDLVVANLPEHKALLQMLSTLQTP